MLKVCSYPNINNKNILPLRSHTLISAFYPHLKTVYNVLFRNYHHQQLHCVLLNCLPFNGDFSFQKSRSLEYRGWWQIWMMWCFSQKNDENNGSSDSHNDWLIFPDSSWKRQFFSLSHCRSSFSLCCSLHTFKIYYF